MIILKRCTVMLSMIVIAGLWELPARADCGCSGNPGTVTSDGTGPCIRYPAPSGPSNDVIFRFDDAYGCGQFAGGDYFVVAGTGGTVVITSIDPAPLAGRHGWAVNPDDSHQHWDDRYEHYQPPDADLPYAAPPGASIVKYVSDEVSVTSVWECDTDGNGPDQKSCGRFAAVLTVLDGPPASPATTFRPPFLGTEKPLFSAGSLQTQILSRLPSSSVPAKIDRTTAMAWTRHFRLDYTADAVYCDLMPPEDSIPNGRSWSTDIWASDTELLAWLNLDDACDEAPCTPEKDLEAKLPVLIGYVQYGIDLWAANRLGISMFRGGGGNGGGKLMHLVFTAAMLNEAMMLDDIAALDPSHFFETASYYRCHDGVALWGQLTGKGHGRSITAPTAPAAASPTRSLPWAGSRNFTGTTATAATAPTRSERRCGRPSVNAPRPAHVRGSRAPECPSAETASARSPKPATETTWETASPGVYRQERSEPASALPGPSPRLKAPSLRMMRGSEMRFRRSRTQHPKCGSRMKTAPPGISSPGTTAAAGVPFSRARTRRRRPRKPTSHAATVDCRIHCVL